jgi:uridine kinase
MKFVAIDGRGGSGKTYLAELLSKRLDAKILHLDDFGNDYEPFIGIPKLVEALDDAETDVVIFEGVGVFDEKFDRFDAYRVLVDTPPDIRRSRAASRDVPRSDRTKEDWEKIFEIWRLAEKAYFTNAVIGRADFVAHESGAKEADAIAAALRKI